MKPFDLEAAKRGEPICLADGQIVDFIGVDSKGYIVVESDLNWAARIDCFYSGELHMAPKKRTVWVNLYGYCCASYHDTQEEADKASQGRRIGKAYPAEIEE